MRSAAVQAGKALTLLALGAFPIVVHAGLLMGQSTFTPVLSALQLLGSDEHLSDSGLDDGARRAGHA